MEGNGFLLLILSGIILLVKDIYYVNCMEAKFIVKIKSKCGYKSGGMHL